MAVQPASCPTAASAGCSAILPATTWVIANRIRADNADLIAALASVPTDEQRNLIEWTLGRDVRDQDQDGNLAETRRDMGDALHVQPLTLFYSGTAADPVSSVFLPPTTASCMPSTAAPAQSSGPSCPPDCCQRALPALSERGERDQALWTGWRDQPGHSQRRWPARTRRRGARHPAVRHGARRRRCLCRGRHSA